MRKIVAIVLFYLVLTTSLILYFVLNPSPVKLEKGIYIAKPQLINHFQLIDNKGNSFRESNLKGHWSLLFFGFSSCKMICPMTLQMLNQTYENLPELKKPEVVFISVDPEHDSLQSLNQFVHQFNQEFIALRGEMHEINALQKQLHVNVSTTAMSHGTEILLINPEARVQAYFYYPISAKALLADLNRLIN